LRQGYGLVTTFRGARNNLSRTDEPEERKHLENVVNIINSGTRDFELKPLLKKKENTKMARSYCLLKMLK
jgi:hypothetical protein